MVKLNKKDVIPSSITVLNGAGRLVQRECSGREGGAGAVVVRSTGKWGQCGCDPSLSYRLFLKDYKFAPLLAGKKEETGRQRGSCNHSAG